MDVLIVGAGLFGSIAARLCREAGYDVTLFDDRREHAGSPPAACLIKPGWITSLGNKIIDPAFETLDELYGLHTLPFRTPAGTVDVYWVDPSQVLLPIPRKETVLEVGDGYIETTRQRWEGRVLVAAGVWSGALVQCPAIRSLTGSVQIFKGEPKQNRITVWAPYKQSVSFMREPGHTWFGDGTAILYKNWTDDRIEQSIMRAKKHSLPRTRLVKTIIGQRPYMPDHKQGYFEQVYNNTWISTGGAKNGTVIAAYQATQFLEAIS